MRCERIDWRKASAPWVKSVCQNACPAAEQGVLAGDAVDEHIEAAVVTGDAGEQRLDLELDRVIDAYGDAGAAGRRHHPSGLVDGFGPVVGRAVALNATPGAIDGGAGLAEAPRDAAAGPSRGAGNECDLSGEWLFRRHGRSPRLGINKRLVHLLVA